MCGIAGILDSSQRVHITDELIRRFSTYLKYRGPDAQDTAIIQAGPNRVALAAYRLVIIDLSPLSNQPMVDSSGRSTIVYNGEIYNYQKLRDALLQLGMSFRTHSDTEVLLRGFEAWGMNELLERVEGMFAFCICDHTSGKLFLARDRLGKKPLLYHHDSSGVFAFSSDIRSFNVYPANLTLDSAAIGYYFSELTTPDPLTVFAEVKKLPAGHWMETDGRHIDLHHYWEPEIKEETNRRPSLKELERHIVSAVEKRLIADVPVGSLLSGGLDSGLITAIAARKHGRRFPAFTAGFTYQSFDERPYARLVAEKYGLDHHELLIDTPDLDTVDRIIEEFGEPFGDSSMIPTYLISKYAAQHVKVVLSGDGGDELFLGYPTYRWIRKLERLQALRPLDGLIRAVGRVTGSTRWQKLGRLLRDPDYWLVDALYRSMGFKPDDLAQLTNGWADGEAVWSSLRQVVSTARRYSPSMFGAFRHASIRTRLLNDYLVKVDRGSMMASLELRSPYLDRPLLRYVSGIPGRVLMRHNRQKALMKSLARKHLPAGILSKPKSGFGVPVGEWFKDIWRGAFEENVLKLGAFPLPLDLDLVKRYWNEHLKGHVDHSSRLWLLYSLSRWFGLQTVRISSTRGTLWSSKGA